MYYSIVSLLVITINIGLAAFSHALPTSDNGILKRQSACVERCDDSYFKCLNNPPKKGPSWSVSTIRGLWIPLTESVVNRRDTIVFVYAKDQLNFRDSCELVR